jgi:hypothetical protein
VWCVQCGDGSWSCSEEQCVTVEADPCFSVR